MSPIDLLTDPVRLERALEQLGFDPDCNPFEPLHAEALDAERLEEIFVVPHEGYEQAVAARSTALFAPLGGGKTCIKLFLANRFGPQAAANAVQHTLAISYDDWQAWADEPEKASVAGHIQRLLEILADAILQLPATRTTAKQIANDIEQLAQKAWPPPGALRALDEARHALKQLGVTQLFVLIDNIDGYARTDILTAEGRQAAVQILAPFFSRELLQLKSDPELAHLYWKIFLPIQLRPDIETIWGARTRRIELANIVWTPRELLRLLKNNLSWASNSQYSHLDELFKGSVQVLSTLDDKVVETVSNGMSQAPTPREVLYLCKLLLEEYAIRIGQKPEGQVVVSDVFIIQDWNRAKEKWERQTQRRTRQIIR